MAEWQASLFMVTSPWETLTQCRYRCGTVVYHRRGRRGRQMSDSLPTDAFITSAADALHQAMRHATSRLRDVGGEIRIHGLCRRRGVSDVPSWTQEFSGFWGTIQPHEEVQAGFGQGKLGQLVFRRGPWENWPRTLPAIDSCHPGCRFITSPYCATLLHEALGHATEFEYLTGAPFQATQAPRLSCPHLTVLDAPDIEDLAGSMSLDDCGQPASRTTLIHRGVLVGDLDRERGVWRRGTYRQAPMIRASNFVITAGPDDPSTWFRQADRVFYLSWIQSGKWVPGTDTLRVLTGPVFELKRGEPVAFAPWLYLEFAALDLLKRIVGVGRDFTLDPHVHWCVKRHQAVPMSLGSPSLLIDSGVKHHGP